MKAVCLLSGGLDSTTLLYHAKRTCDAVTAISFRYGSRHNAKEISCAAYHAHHLHIPHRVIALDWIVSLFRSTLLTSSKEDVPNGHYEDASMRSTVVPFRNGIFLSIAVGLAESLEYDAVAYGAHAGDRAVYPDCRPSFWNFMRSAAQEGTYRRIAIEAPFLILSKADIVEEAISLGVPLGKTWTCYRDGDKHCGRCGSCTERREAFVGKHDPVEYVR